MSRRLGDRWGAEPQPEDDYPDFHERDYPAPQPSPPLVSQPREGSGSRVVVFVGFALLALALLKG